MTPLRDRLARALAAAFLLAAPSGAAVLESVRVEAPSAPLAAPVVLSAAAFASAPALPTTLSAPSVYAAPSAAPSAAPVPVVSGWAHARAAAEVLGERRGVPLAGHDFFYEMLARYLYNGMDDAALAELSRRPETLTALPSADRWGGKLARDLAQPYDDAQALARLDHLQKELEDCARWLQARAPHGGYRLALMGGLLRGRASAHSDADLMLYTDDPQLLRDAMNGPFGYLAKGRDAVLGPVPKNPRLLAAMGETVDLGDGAVVLEDPAFVRGVFFRARAALASAPMERDARLDAELMARIKRLGVERDIDALADELPPPAAPLGSRPARFVTVGASVVDRHSPGAPMLLATVGRSDGRPVIGLYDPRTGMALNAFVLGAYGVREHRDALPKDADPRDFVGWTAQLTPDGRLRFAGSGGVFGPLTPRLRRAVARHLGVFPAEETALGRWARELRAVLDGVLSLLPR